MHEDHPHSAVSTHLPRRLTVMRLLAGVLAMAIATAVGGRDVAGFDVPETVRLEPEEVELRLNGAHVRSSFFRPVTLFALYTFAPAASFEALVADGKPKRVAVTILRPEFSAESFRSGWQEQFAQALAEMEAPWLDTVLRWTPRHRCRTPSAGRRC